MCIARRRSLSLDAAGECAQEQDVHRYSASMGPELLPHWRKSSQWFSLTREHATHVLADASVLATFAAFCRNAWDAEAQRCVGLEHLMRSG